MTTYSRPWTGEGGKNKVSTFVKVEKGFVVDAWVDQVGGNFRSSGGERNLIGKSEDYIKAAGFKKYGK